MSFKDKFAVGRGGMDLDSLTSRTPGDSWKFAMNAVIKNRHNRNFGIGPEHSTEFTEDIKDCVGSIYLDNMNSTLYFTKEQDIKLFDHKTKKSKFVFNASEFGCDFGLGNCEYHDITFQTIKDTIVYFSSQGIYYSFNLDEMLSPKRKEGLKKSITCEGCIKACDIFKIFLPSCGIKINAARQKGAGGALKAGQVSFVARYITKSGGHTNWGYFSNPVNISSDHNVAGEDSRDSALLKISGLDCKYNRLEIAAVEIIGGVPTAKLLNRIGFKGKKLSYVYSGTEGEPISIEELLLTDNTNLKGRYLLNKDSVMYYYGIEPVPEYNVQKIANKVTVKVGEYQVPYELAKKYDLKTLMGGETYALGLWLNRDDGTTTYAGTIPGTPGGSGGSTTSSTNNTVEGTSEGVTGGASSGSLDITLTQGRSIENTRSGIDGGELQERSSAGNESGDAEAIIAAWITRVEDLCEALKPGCLELMQPGSGCECGASMEIYCESEEKKREAALCNQDIARLDALINNHMDVLSDYGIDETDVDFSPATIKASAQRILEVVKKRERLKRTESTFTTTYSGVNYPGATAKSKTATLFGDSFHDADGDEDFDISYYKISEANTIPKVQVNQFYPCYVDCNGDFVYGDKASQPVTHHYVYDRSINPHFVSTSHGVQGKFNTEDPTADLYVNLLGLKFDNIEIPSEEELGFKLCPNNPYTIGMVPLTEANKSVQYKGVAFSTMKISNGGKEYDTQRHGLNSREELSRYHNGTGEFPRLANLGSGDSHVLYSLDALIKGEPISANRLRTELMLSGQGERFGLYATGKEPADSIKGTRVDNRGARSHVYLSKSSASSSTANLDFLVDVAANGVFSPPPGGTKPLNNLSSQACTWIKAANLTDNLDSSFTSDVLNYNVPIPEGRGQYVAVVSDKPDQYGPVDNLTYEPVLWGRGSSVEGLVGSCYVGLFSFLKTSYVSDKVGSSTNKFNIPAQVPIKKQRRCICDSPDDALLEDAGLYMWTELPEEGNAADAKNWAGGHTIIGSRTMTYNESVGNAPISGYYFPKVQKTLVTVPVESYVCPWLIERGETLDKQVPLNLKLPYTLDSGSGADADTAGWEESYLNQGGYLHKQPSIYRRILKVLVRVMLISILPTWAVSSLFDIASPEDVVGTLIKSPMMAAMWYQLKDQILPNNILDKLLGIPVCKTDDRGGETDGSLRGFFSSFFQYNLDYSTILNFKFIEGIPNNFNDCRYKDSNVIYVSDQQSEFIDYDSLKHVRPRNKIAIPTELGKLTNLFTTRGNFYAHTTDHIIPLQYNNSFIPTSLGEIQMGTGNILRNFNPIGSGIQEGLAGLAHKWLSKSTYLGQLFIDVEGSKLYLFDGKLNEFSGMSDVFFKEHLRFCTESDCKYERLTGVPHFDFAVDYNLDRILVTKIDGDKQAKELKGSTWTMSFDIDSQKFISFHSYTPEVYFFDRGQMFSLNDGKLWQHGVLDSFRKIYDEYDPFIVEFVTVNPSVTDKGSALTQNLQFNNITVNADVTKHNGRNVVRDLDKFFNKIAYYNNTQGSGTLAIEMDSDNAGNQGSMEDTFKQKVNTIKFKKGDRMFFADYLKDYTKTACAELPLVKQELCDYTYQINEEAFVATPETMEGYFGEVLADKFLVIRFTLDNEEDININLLDFNMTKNEKGS